jgi:hypothetical protein
MMILLAGSALRAQEIAATIPIPSTPYLRQPAIDAERRRVYEITNTAFAPSTLVVIDATTNTVAQTIPLGVFVGAIAFNPANDRIYLPVQLGARVLVVDADTLAQSSVGVPGCPTGIDVNPVANKIYVTSQCWALNDKLFVLDGATHAVSGPFDLNGVAGEVTVNSATGRIYATAGTSCANLKTRVFNGADNSILTDLPNISILQASADPGQNRVYAFGISPSNCAGTDLRVLDGNSHAILAMLPFPNGRVAVNPDLNRLYVAFTDLDEIAVYDTTNYAELARIPVGDVPHHLAVDRTTARIYAAHFTDPPQVTVLEGVPDEFADEFNASTLDQDWIIVPGTCNYSLTENPGHLRYRPDPIAQPLGCGLQLMRAFRGDQWTLETAVTYFTGPSGGGRQNSWSISFGARPGPHSAHNSTDFIVFWRQRDDWSGTQPGDLVLVFVENGQAVLPAFRVPLNPNFTNVGGNVTDSYVLRIRRTGRTVTFEVSDDGVNVRFSASHTYGSHIDGLVQFMVVHGNSFANWDSYADYDYFRLSLGQPNQPPMADAGADQSVECASHAGTEVTLDGSGSSDPDGDALSYEWRDAEGNILGNSAQLTLTLPLGQHIFTLTVTDAHGAASSDSVAVEVVDTTPPALTLANSSVTVVVPTASATGVEVDVLAASGAAASDACDPSPALSHNGPAEFPIGTTIVTITARDHSGNIAQQQFAVQVVYNFGGFQMPIRSDGSSIFRAGRIIPIRFQLTAADGSYITNAVATLAVFRITDAILGTTEEITPDAAGNSNSENLFRFDADTNSYLYNLSTSGYPAGSYLLRVLLNDGTTHEVMVSVRS